MNREGSFNIAISVSMGAQAHRLFVFIIVVTEKIYERLEIIRANISLDGYNQGFSISSHIKKFHRVN